MVNNFIIPENPIVLSYVPEKAKYSESPLARKADGLDELISNFYVPADLYFIKTGEEPNGNCIQGIHSGRTSTLLEDGEIKIVRLEGRDYAVNVKGCGSVIPCKDKLEKCKGDAKMFSDIHYLRLNGANKKFVSRLKQIISERDAYLISGEVWGNSGTTLRPTGGHILEDAEYALKLSSDDIVYAGDGMFKIKDTHDFNIAPVVSVTEAPEDYDKSIKSYVLDVKSKMLGDTLRKAPLWYYKGGIGQEIRLFPTNSRFLECNNHGTDVDVVSIAKTCENTNQFEKLFSKVREAYFGLGLMFAQTLRQKNGNYEMLMSDCEGHIGNSVCSDECYAFVDLESLKWYTLGEYDIEHPILFENGLGRGWVNRPGILFKSLMKRKYELEGKEFSDEYIAELFESLTEARHPCLEKIAVEKGNLVLNVKALNADVKATETIRPSVIENGTRY